MENSNYPSYITKDVIAAHERVVHDWGEEGDIVARRLIFRPCMEKVYRDVGKLLNGLPEAPGPSGSVGTPWDWFLEIMVTVEGEYNWISKTIKPARKELKQRMKKIHSSGAQLLTDLKWALGGSDRWLNHLQYNRSQYHGLSLPDEFEFEMVEKLEKIIEAASTWDGKSAYDEFAAICEGGVFKKSSPEIHYAKSVYGLLRHACEHGSYGFPAVEKFRLPYLLSYDNYARITRAALDLPDDLGPYRRPFSGEDLRLAKAFSKTTP